MMTTEEWNDKPAGFGDALRDALNTFSIDTEVARLRALVDECADYLKESETPRQRMDRDHADVLALMEMLSKDRKERDDLRAENARLREALEWYEPRLNRCNAYGSDGDTARDALAKDTGKRARAALSGPAPGEGE